MAARIFSFAGKRPRQSTNWTAQELAELYRVSDRLGEAGLRVVVDSGLSDEGEPWAVFEQCDTGDVIVHIARIDGELVVVNAIINQVYRGADFRSVTDQMLRDAPLAMPRGATRSNVVIHPRAVLTAFVAAAVVLTEMVRGIEPAHAAEDGNLLRAAAASHGGGVFTLLLSRLLSRDGSAFSTSVTALTSPGSFGLVAASVSTGLVVGDILTVNSDDRATASVQVVVAHDGSDLRTPTPSDHIARPDVGALGSATAAEAGEGVAVGGSGHVAPSAAGTGEQVSKIVIDPVVFVMTAAAQTSKTETLTAHPGENVVRAEGGEAGVNLASLENTLVHPVGASSSGPAKSTGDASQAASQPGTGKAPSEAEHGTSQGKEAGVALDVVFDATLSKILKAFLVTDLNASVDAIVAKLSEPETEKMADETKGSSTSLAFSGQSTGETHYNLKIEVDAAAAQEGATSAVVSSVDADGSSPGLSTMSGANIAGSSSAVKTSHADTVAASSTATSGDTTVAATKTAAGSVEYDIHVAQAGTTSFTFKDGIVDVLLCEGGVTHLYDFKFGEDLIIVNGATSTQWISSATVVGDDVKIVGIDGGVVWLHDALSLHT
jgi:hypothetical protein